MTGAERRATAHTWVMRVVAGTARGRRLAVPADDGIRPTGDRVREAMFNALHSRRAVVGATVLDLFAGTGALGIEALSRGAASAVFVEHSRTHAAIVEANLETCGFTDLAEVVVADGPTWLAANAGPWDLVLCDPPYAFDDWPALLAGLDATLVVVESDRELEQVPGWHVGRERRYAGTVVSILSPEGGDPGSSTP